MIPLHEDPHFTFRFAEARREPIMVRAGDAFIAISEQVE